MARSINDEVGEIINGYETWFSSPGALDSGRMTSKYYPYDSLFTPIRVNGITLKNRIVMAPMGNFNMVEETGRPGPQMIAYLTERAKGGAGLITTGAVPVADGIDPSLADLDNLTIFPRIGAHRTDFSGWRALAAGVHSYGAKLFIQLSPGFGRVGNPECVVKKWKLPVSSSWNPSLYMPLVPCRPLRGSECLGIIRAMGQAAIDAREMGIDGAYVHGHDGYLLEQMTDPAFNRRRFGRYADWQAFGIDIVRAIRERCGDRYPVMYRIGITAALEETYGGRMKKDPVLKKFRNGRTPEMTLEFMARLVEAGVDMFDFDLGCYENSWLPHPAPSLPAGPLIALSGIIKRYFAEKGIKANTGLEVPIVCTGKLGYPDLAEKALRDGMADLVMLGRPLLADPYWPRKAYAGEVSSIRPCIGDQEACVNELVHGGHLQCGVNPRTGFEYLFPDEDPGKATRSRKIAVVGAGPGGVVCACAAARRGHAVTLLEKTDRVGGALLSGGVPAIKFDIVNYCAYLSAELERASSECRLDARFGAAADCSTLAAEQFDAVVIATGARPVMPRIPGIELPHVVRATDLLLDPSLARNAESIAVIGGGFIGCEAAHFLAYELGKKVCVIEARPQFMEDAFMANRSHILYAFAKKGVALYNCATVVGIGPDSITLSRNRSKTVPDPLVSWRPLLPKNVKNPLERKIRIQNREETIRADLVVISVGMASDNDLYYACVKHRVAPEIHLVGDALNPGMAWHATRAGYRIALML